jgi:hypothetical protein
LWILLDCIYISHSSLCSCW